MTLTLIFANVQIKGRPVYIREDREDKDLIDELQKTGPGDYKKRPRSNGRPGAQFTRGVGRGGPVVGSVEVGYGPFRPKALCLCVLCPARSFLLGCRVPGKEDQTTDGSLYSGRKLLKLVQRGCIEAGWTWGQSATSLPCFSISTSMGECNLREMFLGSVTSNTLLSGLPFYCQPPSTCGTGLCLCPVCLCVRTSQGLIVWWFTGTSWCEHPPPRASARVDLHATRIRLRQPPTSSCYTLRVDSCV